MALPNQPPTRHTSGVSTDFKTQPFGNIGLPNPLFYHLFSDDFDQEVNETGAYTKTTTGNGTIALTAGDGGLALFTTNSTTPLATDVASIQLPVAGFTYTAQKRLAWQCRLALSDITNSAFVVGLIQTTATPFTVTDGIYFSKASASTSIVLNSAVGSVITSIAIPTAALNLVNGQFFDLGFFIAPTNSNNTIDVQGFYGSVTGGNPLVGWVPPQVGGARGAVCRLTAPTFTTANLNLTLALQSGTTTSKTATVDYHAVAKER